MTTFAQPSKRFEARTTQRPQRSAASQDRTARTRELFTLAMATNSPEEAQSLRDTVISLHLDLAHAEAARYRSRGIPLDDLRQVAALALTKAARGLRRHHRTRLPVLRGAHHPRRAAQALPRPRLDDPAAAPDPGAPGPDQRRRERAVQQAGPLTPARSRSPTTSTSAIESVIEALASDGCFVPASLDHPTGVDGATTLGDLLPVRRRRAPRLRGAADAAPGAARARRARPPDPGHALLRGPHPARDRRAGSASPRCRSRGC